MSVVRVLYPERAIARAVLGIASTPARVASKALAIRLTARQEIAATAAAPVAGKPEQNPNREAHAEEKLAHEAYWNGHPRRDLRSSTIPTEARDPGHTLA
jgi:hypothetical protein